MSVLKSFTALNAALTESAVKAPLTFSSALVAMAASTTPIWLNEPSGIFGAYFLSTSRYSWLSGPLALVRFSSALTPSLPSHWDPSASDRKSVLHGVRSEEHTSELQSHVNLVCRLLL